ncbi:MAG: phage major capsid protein [Sandarakinorhabdus sp.]|jgi:HK97 family phage major capsid protein|nr:phage major capsid protein [Sandarakinorhabdus sp.]
MQTIAELRAAGKAAIDAAREINDRAKAENRDLTEAEEKDYAAKLVEHRSFEKRIAREEELRALGGNAANPLKVAGEERGDGNIGLTGKDVARFSMVRLMRALANPNDRSAQAAAAFELEASAEAAKKVGNQGGELRGVTIPNEVLIRGVNGAERRDLTVGTATEGGNTVQTDLLATSFIDILRNRMSVMQAGATMLEGLSGNVAIPRQTGAATAAWVTEGNAPAESQQAFDQVGMGPKTVAAFVDVSRRLMLQSSLSVEAFVRNDLAQVLALAIDLGALNGSGSAGQPRGILQTAGIGSVAIGTNGGPATWDHIVDLETVVGNANADVPTSAYLTNAAQRGRLKKTAELGATNGLGIWRDNEVNGYRAIASNQVPRTLTKGTGTNLSAIIFGNFADLIIGMWGGLDLLVDPFTSSTTGTTRFVAMQDVDSALRRLASFAAITDATA